MEYVPVGTNIWKNVPGANININCGDKLTHPLKRSKRNYNGVIWYITCNMELRPYWFNNLYGIDTSEYFKQEKQLNKALDYIKIRNIIRMTKTA